MGREFELKYRATPEQLEQIAGDYTGFAVIRMETTYYDVPSGLLGQLHWTLRRRMENEASICTLKTNLPGGGRGEWEVECADILEAVPRLIAIGAPAELAGITAGGVAPTCGARFTRRALTVPAGSGTVEIALDQGVLTGGGQELTFAEAEVELKQGSDEDATTFGTAFAAKYGLVTEKKSKLRRALALAGR